MKKLLIATLVLIAAYAVGAAVLAVANGQAEGKVVSEQKQLLTDGDMEESGTGSWSIYHASASKVAGAARDGNQILRILYAGNAVGSAYQSGYTVGKTYHLTGWARGDGTSVPEARTNTQTLWTGTASTEWQRIDAVFVYSGNGNFQIGSSNFQTASYVEFDDVFLTEYTGDMTSAQQQLLTDGDMEASDTSAWTAGGGATLSKETGAAGDGDYILRVTRVGADGRALQTILSAGARYQVTGWARSDGSGIPTVKEPGISASWTGTASTDWQYFDVVFTAQTTQLFLSKSTSDGNYVEFDNAFITEL